MSGTEPFGIINCMSMNARIMFNFLHSTLLQISLLLLSVLQIMYFQCLQVVCLCMELSHGPQLRTFDVIAEENSIIIVLII
jgi:hypothetical protein